MTIYHIIYKTTNIVNNKFYIGKHSTTDLDDLYLGSGKYLIRAIKKYGCESFKKEILFIFKTENEAYDKEAELVTKELIENPNCYNLQTGGLGGRTISEETRAKMSKAQSGKNNPHYGRTGNRHPMYGKKHSVETKQQIGKTCSIKLTGRKLSSETKNKIRLFNLGKKHSPETKLKMSNSRKGISHPKVTCPHCNKSGGGNSMKRWHFKNCRWRD